MKHVIRITEAWEQGWRRPRLTARVVRGHPGGGEIVHTTEADRAAEVVWEDAARWCRRNGIEVES